MTMTFTNQSDYQVTVTETLVGNAEAYAKSEQTQKSVYNFFNPRMTQYIADKFLAYDLVGVQAIGPATEPLDGIGSYYLLSYLNPDEPGRLVIQVQSHIIEATIDEFYINWMLVGDDETWLGDQILIHINRDLLNRIGALCPVGHKTTVEQLPWKIISQATLIGQRSRRGAGNWCVIPSQYIERLQQDGSGFVQTGESSPQQVVEIGSLSGIRVFADPEAKDVLVGYRGSHADCGMVYCPFVPVIMADVSIDPATYAPLLRFRSWSGYGLQTRSEGRLFEAADYYARLEIENEVPIFSRAS